MSVYRPMITGFSLIVILTGLSWRAINPRAEQFDLALNDIDRLELVQDALYRDLLETRIGLSRNYDLVVSEMDGSHRLVSHLEQTASFDEQTREVISHLKDSIDREESLIESFKRENAVLRNSLAFFARFAIRTGVRELDAAIGAAATSILHLTLDTSPDAVANAAMRLENLERQAEVAGQSAEVEPLVAHGRLLHRLLPSIDDTLKETLILTRKADLDALRDLIQIRQVSSRNTARGYRSALYLASLALLAFLVYLGIRLKALVADLQKRAALEHLLADISMQLVKTAPGEIDAQIERAIGQLGSHSGYDRAYLVMPGELEKAYRWHCASAPFPPGWPDAVLELAALTGERGHLGISAPRVGRLPAGRTKSQLDQLGVYGWACVTGIDRQGRVLALGLETLNPVSTLFQDSSELTLLRMLLDTFIHVIDRRSIEEERIRLQGRIQRSSRMEEIGALSSGIAHNFNNILGGILGHVEMMQDSIAVSGDSTRHLVVIRKGAERARDLVRQILAFGRRREIGWRPVRMVELTRETIRLCQASLTSKIELEMTSVPSGVIVTGDAVQLQQVILNLCQNADDAMGGKGCIQVIVETGQTETKISLMHGELASGGYMRISVVDTGIGMDACVLDRVFEPFFTTKPDGNGLGLATVRDIVCDHRGGIDVANLPGGGSRFEVWLPLRAETNLLPAATTSDDGLGRGEAVMLLEPDKDRLLGDEEKLAALGYEAVGFTTAEAAIDACITRSGGFDFVVLGQLGSLEHSLEVANDLRQVLPFTPFIVATTSASGTDPGSLVAAGVSDVVRWPICLEEIAAVLSRLSQQKFKREISAAPVVCS